MPSYSNELRDAVLRRVLPPQKDSISKVAAEEGISGQTIRNWISKAREAGSTAADVSTQPEKWSSQDKFCIVIETAGMTGTELAEYAGKKGLSTEEIKAWREACMNANGGSASETARLQRENRELERKLRSSLPVRRKCSLKWRHSWCWEKKPAQSGGTRRPNDQRPGLRRTFSAD